jgi:cytochrome c peroxidase
MKNRWMPLSLLIAVALWSCNTAEPNPADTSAEAESLSFQTSGDPNLRPFLNPSGWSRTISLEGKIDTSNPFFQNIGTNNRSCLTCHQPSEGWTVTPAGIQRRFWASYGTDPIFRLVDGANSPNAKVSSLFDRRKAYSMLLEKGLIRVGLPIPTNAEFTLEAVDDPYGFASAQELSLFRRPLPTANLNFLSAAMWDGRESILDSAKHIDLNASLVRQSNDATRGHAQSARDLTDTERQSIVNFETKLFSSQVFDFEAGRLNAKGANGGPEALSAQEFFIGINDPLGLNPSGKAFDPTAMTLFSPWQNLIGSGELSEARRAVARGQQIFNTKPINIVGVNGLNDNLGVPSIPGTCTTCHDSPNVGNHSVIAPLNIGLTDVSRRTPDLPLYTLKNKLTLETRQTTDPGRALITGKWADIGKFKGPILRNLAARAPYFHNGSAATLRDAVNFYNQRFSIGLSESEIQDLVAFLKTI